jgi:hypothetical protein
MIYTIFINLSKSLGECLEKDSYEMGNLLLYENRLRSYRARNAQSRYSIT